MFKSFSIIATIGYLYTVSKEIYNDAGIHLAGFYVITFYQLRYEPTLVRPQQHLFHGRGQLRYRCDIRNVI